MRKVFAIIPIAALILMMVSVVPTALAGTTTIHFEMTDSSPVMSDCVPNSGLYYDIATISVDTDGSYTFTASNIVASSGSPVLSIYVKGTFNPGNHCDNRLGVGYGSMTVSLTANVDYSLVGILYPGFGNTGSYDVNASGPGNFSGSGGSAPADPGGDPDGDGIATGSDNCPYDYNPDQEDGWGSPMGDLCDTEWYNRTGQQVAGFVQKDGMYHLHGNCLYLDDGAPRCPVIAAFDPATFDPAQMPMEISSGDAGTWSVWLHYLHSNNGADVYQVNVYSTNPPQPDTLVDDRLEIHVTGDSWQWYHRGGHMDYHGI